jgi:hypothetical protein
VEVANLERAVVVRQDLREPDYPLAMPAVQIPVTARTLVSRNNNSNNNNNSSNNNRMKAVEDIIATTNHRLHYPNAPIVSPD